MRPGTTETDKHRETQTHKQTDTWWVAADGSPGQSSSVGATRRWGSCTWCWWRRRRRHSVQTPRESRRWDHRCSLDAADCTRSRLPDSLQPTTDHTRNRWWPHTSQDDCSRQCRKATNATNATQLRNILHAVASLASAAFVAYYSCVACARIG